MKVTVAICTWNRANLLDQTLEHMRSLIIPDGVTWELLVVNNNCTDNTDEVIEKHMQSLPLKRLFEPKQGHSNARNCAIEHARGELMLWTDDDVIVDPFWIEAYTKVFAHEANAAYFGGTIEPWFEITPPKWLSWNLDLFHGAYAIKLPGQMTRPIVDPETPFGANMAFRTVELTNRRFDPSLGRIGPQMTSGDECQLISQLRKDGKSGIWVGAATVKHFIPASRMTHKYLWDYYHGIGCTQVIIEKMTNSQSQSTTSLRVRYWIGAFLSSLLHFHGGYRWAKYFTSCAISKGKLDSIVRE